MSKKVRVLVVDDSAVMRELLSEILGSDAEIEVVGAAADPYIAREKIKLLNPDVLTLDIEMPRMDGMAFLGNLMRLRPMPVVMCSSLTQRGADIVLDALNLGAVDYIAKPSINAVQGMREAAQEIIAKVKAAAGAQVRRLIEAPAIRVEDNHSADVVLPKRRPLSPIPAAERIIAIGASTGGTEAIKEVLARLPTHAPGVVVVQHIPKAFSAAFAARMNSLCEIEVCEAADGLPILSGHAYIAPGDQHLMVVRAGPRYICRLSDAAPVNRHKPSVDVLFRSVAQVAADKAVGVILTGMGKDGAVGMKEMREAGAMTLAQDEDSSVVWGMPGAAWEIGAAQALYPVTGIAGQILTYLSGKTHGQRNTQSA